MIQRNDFFAIEQSRTQINRYVLLIWKIKDKKFAQNLPREWASQVACDKESACQGRRHGFHLWVRKIPWRRTGQSTLVFLPGESHGQRSLVGCSPWSCKRVGHDLATEQEACVCMLVASVMSDSLWPHGLSPPGPSVYGILQARILEWVSLSSSRGSSWPRDEIHLSYVSCIGIWVLYH